MKGLAAFCVVTILIGCLSLAPAQSDHAASLPTNNFTNTGIGTTSKTASGASPTPGSTPDETETAEEDDSLYRGKTSELAATMMRDEGMLHFKTRPNEKARKVDSLKSLPSSGTDPKFQGELAISGVSSIDKIAAKPAEVQDAGRPEDPSDPRFRTRQLIFTPQAQEKPKKAEADANTSPSPSASASPKANSSPGSKE
ncbi:MAG TPA: hypothetical protein VH170_05355 [Chthoniobacterales bacterium]|jgi:hypothetical protein|nr:hypothetical protein [Chthoniobacterales bacterium]